MSEQELKPDIVLRLMDMSNLVGSPASETLSEAAKLIDEFRNTHQHDKARYVEAIERLPNETGIGKASDMVRIMALHDAIAAIEGVDYE